jgi:transposase
VHGCGIIRSHVQRLQQTSARNTFLEAHILTLTEQLNLVLARRYAARSEKLAPDQSRLFDGAETDAGSDETAGDEDRDDDADTDTDTVEIGAHLRKKRGRKPLPEALPQIELIHDLPAEERICPHDGRELKAIGEAVSEQLDIVPATIQVIRHIRRKYACDCGQCIKTEPMAPQPIPKSLASPGRLAHAASGCIDHVARERWPRWLASDHSDMRGAAAQPVVRSAACEAPTHRAWCGRLR